MAIKETVFPTLCVGFFSRFSKNKKNCADIPWWFGTRQWKVMAWHYSFFCSWIQYKFFLFMISIQFFWFFGAQNALYTVPNRIIFQFFWFFGAQNALYTVPNRIIFQFFQFFGVQNALYTVPNRIIFSFFCSWIQYKFFLFMISIQFFWFFGAQNALYTVPNRIILNKTQKVRFAYIYICAKRTFLLFFTKMFYVIFDFEKIWSDDL